MVARLHALSRARLRAALRVAGCGALLWCVALPASAQTLDEALAHYREGRLEEAVDALDGVRRSAAAEPRTLITAHLYLGVLHATMGDEPLARRDFAVALALDPELEAPSELSPALREVFDAVRGETAPAEIAVEPEGEPTAGAPVSLAVAVRNVPAHAAAAIRVRAEPEDGEAWITRVEGLEGEVEVPASAWSGGARLRLVVEALSPHGGVLARSETPLRGGLPAVAAAGGPAAPIEEGDDGGGSVVEEAWFWILIGVLVAGGVAAAVLIPTVGVQREYDLQAPVIVRM